MTRLPRGDLETALDLLGIACELEGPEPFPVALLDELRRASRALAVEYHFVDRMKERYVEAAFVSDDARDVVGPDAELVWENYWCPLFHHVDTTGDRSAMRLSDVTSRRAWRELPLYRELYHPAGIEWTIMVPLPAPRGLDRLLLLTRGRGARDFSATNRDLLELLRPHFARNVELAELRRRLAEVPPHAVSSNLTDREQEVLDLVAEGKTNAEIATLLWVAPSTVKKHLENVYEKLRVANRAAAVAARVPHAYAAHAPEPRRVPAAPARWPEDSPFGGSTSTMR